MPHPSHIFDADDDFDNVWFICMHCKEEYHLPENQEKCPICGNEELEAV